MLCLCCLYPNPPGPGDEENLGKYNSIRMEISYSDTSNSIGMIDNMNTLVMNTSCVDESSDECARWLLCEYLYPNPPGPGARDKCIQATSSITSGSMTISTKWSVLTREESEGRDECGREHRV